MYTNEVRISFVSTKSRSRIIVKAVAARFELVLRCFMCLRFSAFDSVKWFYKGHKEEDEHCITIQVYISNDYLPEEESW